MTRLAIPVLRPIDGNGDVYPSGTLTFYEAGASSVLKTVYSDSALSVSLGSTVTADGEGLFTDIYYDSDIRLVLKNSAGVIQITRDIYEVGNVDTADITDLAVTTGKIADNAVTLGKLLVLDNAKLITSNGSANSQVAVSGDVTMSNTGVFTLANTASRIWKSSSVAGTANAITAVSSPVITSLADGAIYLLKPTSSNTTTTPTFAPDGLTARTIVSNFGALKAGDIQSGKYALMVYDLTNTRWILVNPAYAGMSPIGAPAAQATLTGATTKTFAHGLSSTPTFVSCYITCTDAGGDAGYALDDIILLGNACDGNGANSYGLTTYVDATNIYVSLAADRIVVAHKTTGVATAITAADWTLGVRCFY